MCSSLLFISLQKVKVLSSFPSAVIFEMSPTLAVNRLSKVSRCLFSNNLELKKCESINKGATIYWELSDETNYWQLSVASEVKHSSNWREPNLWFNQLCAMNNHFGSCLAAAVSVLHTPHAKALVLRAKYFVFDRHTNAGYLRINAISYLDSTI